jgi:Lrp/AsnC family leucine-responsive transcriptional regulator
MKKKLDNFDKAILNIIQKDCRTSNKKVGTMVSLSETPVQVRIQNMHVAGYIKRFSAILDPGKIGMELIAYIHVKLLYHTEKSLSEFMTEACKLEEITECYHMSGTMDFLLRVVIKNIKEYSDLFTNKLGNLPGSPHYETFFVITEGKCETQIQVK